MWIQILWFKTKMTYQQLFKSISSAPRCKYLSGNLFTISSNKASKNSKVESDVGSMGPKIPVSFPLYSQGVKSPGWPNSHDFVWPGVSNSGITLIPLILACSMILLKLKFTKFKPRPSKFFPAYWCTLMQWKFLSSTLLQWNHSTYSITTNHKTADWLKLAERSVKVSIEPAYDNAPENWINLNGLNLKIKK